MRSHERSRATRRISPAGRPRRHIPGTTASASPDRRTRAANCSSSCLESSGFHRRRSRGRRLRSGADLQPSARSTGSRSGSQSQLHIAAIPPMHREIDRAEDRGTNVHDNLRTRRRQDCNGCASGGGHFHGRPPAAAIRRTAAAGEESRSREKFPCPVTITGLGRADATPPSSNPSRKSKRSRHRHILHNPIMQAASRRPAWWTVAALSVALTLAGQQDQRKPDFRSSVELVTTDVGRSRQERPVLSDLKSTISSFLEDGVPQKLVSFSMTHGGADLTTSPRRAARTGVRGHPAAGPASAGRRKRTGVLRSWTTPI